MSEINELDALLTEWHAAEKQAAHWKDKEQTLRKKIFELAFPTPVVGTNKVRISHGMALVGKYSMNYGIDRPLLEAMMGMDNVRPILDEVVSYSPRVKEGAWKKLADEDRKLIAPAFTETPAMPALEIKPAAKLRW